jgi:hypothetical protein
MGKKMCLKRKKERKKAVAVAVQGKKEDIFLRANLPQTQTAVYR